MTTLLFLLDFYLGRWDRRRRLFERRLRRTRRLQEASPFQEPREPMELTTLSAEEATPARFREASRKGRRPVVIRGLLREARSTRRWSMEYFEEAYGDSRYPVMADSREEDRVTKKSEFEMVTVRELLATIRTGTSFKYVNNLTRIFVDHPELIRDMELQRLLVLFENRKTDECFEAVNMFMGGRGTGANIHCAFAGNFFNNLVGRKEWLLIDPKYSRYLLPIPSHPFFYSDAYFDPGDDETGEFPRRLPSYRVVLEPGDVLYNAPWWWHRVRNLDEFTVGCAVRGSNVAADLANNFLFTVLSEEYKLFLFKALFNAKKKLVGDEKTFRDVLLAELDKDIFLNMTGQEN